MLHREAVRKAIAESAPPLVEKARIGRDNMRHLWQVCAYDHDIGRQLAHFTSLASAVWSGPLATTYAIPQYERATYHVFGIDGSQIYPDHHIGMPAYLLHVSHAQMQFGPHGYADIAAYPYVCIDNDLVSRSYVDMMRLRYEVTHSSWAPPQTCVLFDGPLMWWSLEGTSFLSEACTYLEALYRHNSWYIGYMSSPRFHHIANAVRAVMNTQYCNEAHYAHVEHVPDVHLLEHVLPVWHRTCVCSSTDPIVFEYPEHLQPLFCYVNTGHEIARIDMPRYIAQSEYAINTVMRIVRNQVEKGHGYPVALSEAHEAAVIREYDRQFFFTMLAYYAGSEHVSYKQHLKHAPVM